MTLRAFVSSGDVSPLFTAGSDKTLTQTPGGRLRTTAVMVSASGAEVSGGFLSSATATATAVSYTAGNVIGGVLTFANAGPALGGMVLISNTRLRVNANALQTSEGAYTLHLFSATPPSALANNAAFVLAAGDRAAYIGPISLGTPVDLGDTLFVMGTGVGVQVQVPVGGSLFGYLVNAATFTATAVDRVVTLPTAVI